ncbi:helix-turn-helix domain-containing protein [Acetobacterium paludosum]|uniref:Helix-turn-helix domain-containing protein n=1 Tax=Acetobacterium paludosum TaxID=52693 RepID=A0A923KWV6_9FIRM|nr:helix-turn-helix transcriptional regulator [Acetobacterium paludosum]MBC3888830.1 helix-turn-helix domain-containing protein [Acetobacterium paludosum]
MEKDLLSAQEVADILKIARNTVYALIKRGELSSSKVGKQVRISRDEVESYLKRTMNIDTNREKASKKSNIPVEESNNRTLNQNMNETIRGNNGFIICGQDISLDVLINHLNNRNDSLQIYRSYLSSYNGIYALYQGKVNLVTAHMWDGEVNDYNISYIKKMMPGIPALIMRIGKRQQGLYVQRNNPKNINNWKDLKRSDLTIVNREKGSGTRILLDEKLRLEGIDGEKIEGYFRECKSHLAVANIVSRGGADVGIGSETGCMNIQGVEFIPLQTECYDLVIRLSDADKQPYKTVIEIVTSESFKMDLQNILNYDTSETGRIVE